MLVSEGRAIRLRAETTVWSGTPATWPNRLDLAGYWAPYSAMYRKQIWVFVVVAKRGRAVARLPLKVYERGSDGRPEVRDHPYARLLRRPNTLHDPFKVWQWVANTKDIYGESFLGKVRDRGGRPVELVPMHPTCLHPETDGSGVTVWRFDNGKVRIENIPDYDLVHFSEYDPDTLVRGMSALEPLRATLENEDAARRASSAFWRNGARPSVVLKHPGQLSDRAGTRLRAQWNEIHAGVDNHAKAAILEEGMEAQIVQLSAEDSQYVEGRKLNREEVCAAFDVPPPVVHILDHATFSNITEQMRSMYRDTMAPVLGSLESVLEFDLRASRRPGASEPDFGDAVYAEFLLDEVLRGDFETRQEALKNADHLTVAEKRRIENLPAVDGTDRIFVNAATIPLDAAALAAVGGLVRAGFDPAASLAALGLPEIKHTGVLPVTVQPEEPPRTLAANSVRTLMGRLSFQTALTEVDPVALVAGLPEADASAALAVLAEAAAMDEDVPALRDRLRRLETR